MKRIVSFLLFASFGVNTFAQADSFGSNNSTLKVLESSSHAEYIPVFQYWKEHDIFQHLDVSVTAGTTGVGIDIASPVTEWAQLRLGYEFMPRITKTLEFNMSIGGKPAKSYDADGNREETTFDKMKEFLYSFTGYDIEDHADMVAKPTMNNLKVLVDVFPLKNNRHWHLTAGFYLGPSKFAEAKNSTESMISLVSASIYNKMYESAVNGGNLIDFNNIPSLSGSGIVMPDAVRNKFLEYGDMGFEVGQFSHDFTDEAGNVLKDANGNTIDKGRAYIVQPDEDCLVRVSASSKSFKPYVGFGYSGRLLKNRDDWKISFDCGAMFWGGTPDLVVHHGLKLKDGTYRDVSLINDVENIDGQVGTYIDILRAFKVYPVLSLRLTKRIF